MADGDQSMPVRAEDAFDVGAASAWLRENVDDRLREELSGTPEVRQFPGGASNLTYLMRWPARELILRRPPAGVKAKGAHDMGREYRIQAALAPVFPRVPAMVASCDDESVIGSPFYAMERLVGVVPRRELPPGLTPGATAHLCGNVFDVLVELHSVEVASVPALDALGKGEGYVRRQVDGWTARLVNARTDDLGDWSDVTGWLVEHQPADVASCVVHNDFRLDNLVLDAEDPTRIIGVLDWEMATVGDPLMDLGGALAYWISDDDDEFFRIFRRQPSNAPGMWTREEIVAHYCQRMGYSLTPRQWSFYEVFGLFRLAVIAQQIWYRYVHKQTTNEQYAVFGPAVAHLEQRCRGLIA
ncbi:phosphotransferase family protein [Nocardioides sp. LHG3406-4]|uniref:phosphotransferase family protein n=1 Tax=Nocardioides sp. LHG3406-4 TaxID=2804575 RepID=UPI003CF50796